MLQSNFEGNTQTFLRSFIIKKISLLTIVNDYDMMDHSMYLQE